MNKKHRAVFNDINITPLTDIFLVLLIIMMVVAPMLDYRGLKLSFLSGDAEAEAEKEPKTISVTIAADGGFQLDGAAVGRDSLSAGIQREAREKPDGIIIETHPDAAHEAMTFALDAAQTAGITQIGVTETPAPKLQ